MNKSNPSSIFGVGNGHDTLGNSTVNSRWRVDWVDTFTGSDLPSYRKLIKDGSCATTAASGVKYIVNRTDDPVGTGTLYTIASKRTDTFYGNGFTAGQCPQFSSYNSASIIKADALAMGNYIQNARSVQSSFKGGVFVGELMETIHLLRNPAAAVFELTEALARSYRSAISAGKRLRDIEKALANLWLQYAYGVRPLIADTKDLIDSYNRIMGKRLDLDCRGIGEDATSVQTLDGSVSLWNGFPARRTFNSTSRVTVKYYGKVNAAFAGGSTSVPSSLGFRLDEFLPTVWELIPFSFLADYFANIGSIISALTFVDAALAWTSKTVITESNLDVSFYASNDSFTPVNNYVQSFSLNGGYSTTVQRFQRFPTATAYVPGLTFTVPGSGSSRWYNMAALFSQFKGLTPLLSKLH